MCALTQKGVYRRTNVLRPTPLDEFFPTLRHTQECPGKAHVFLSPLFYKDSNERASLHSNLFNKVESEQGPPKGSQLTLAPMSVVPLDCHKFLQEHSSLRPSGNMHQGARKRKGGGDATSHQSPLVAVTGAEGLHRMKLNCSFQNPG